MVKPDSITAETSGSRTLSYGDGTNLDPPVLLVTTQNSATTRSNASLIFGSASVSWAWDHFAGTVPQNRPYLSPPEMYWGSPEPPYTPWTPQETERLTWSYIRYDYASHATAWQAFNNFTDYPPHPEAGTMVVVTHFKTDQYTYSLHDVWRNSYLGTGSSSITSASSRLIPAGSVATFVSWAHVNTLGDWYGNWRVYVDGEFLYESLRFNGGPNLRSRPRLLRTNLIITPPIVTSSENLVRYVGETPNWTEGVTGTWGVTTGNKIPDRGQVINLSTSTLGYDPALSLTGHTYDFVGVTEHEFELRDEHSLSTLAQYQWDNTFTTTNRTLAIKTTLNPQLEMFYSSTSPAFLQGQIYDPSLPLQVCSGEEGWTSYPLDITLKQGAILGAFDAVLTLPDDNSVATNTSAHILDYHSESMGVAGTPVSGVLTQIGNTTVELSPTVYGLVRIDDTNPVPNVSFHGGSSFTDESDDALSGISGTRPSKIAFSAVDGSQPPSSAFTTFDSIAVPQGTYDVWVWATDKAGNEAIAMVEGGVYIAGEVVINKDTTLGATLHANDCSHRDSVSVDAGCEASCTFGTSIDVTGNMEITYQLTIANADTTLLGKGDFQDYLPLGTELIGTPAVTTSGGETVTIHTATKVSGGTYDGRWQITGDYENLAPGDSFVVSITGSVPAYDDAPGATNIISNQATGTWELATVSSGTMESGYANHLVNPSPKIVKASNWGVASHTEDCTGATSLTLTGNCDTDCITGDSGYVQPGDIVSYELIFDNPSNILQYFATSEAARNYDIFPVSVNATGQTITIDLIDSGGIRTNQFTGIVSPGATGTIYTGTWPDADGNYLNGLAVTSGRIYQNTGTISVAPKSKLIITVGAAVTGNIGDTLRNQAITGHSATGNNTSPLAITDTGVTTIRSNHVTHQIEQGSTLRKWAYSNTPDANNPTLHSVGCPDSGNLFVPGTCLGCALGSAKLQKDTVITYSLTMDNTKNLHRGSDLAGNIASGTPIPGGYIDNKHADAVIPEGLTVDPTSLRIYVTDRNGDSVPISNGSGIFSAPVIVNENGTSVTREVLHISGTNIDIKDTGEGSAIFTLSNISLADNGTRWELNLDNRAYASGMINDYTGYSITYLFDATVTGEHDSVKIDARR